MSNTQDAERDLFERAMKDEGNEIGARSQYGGYLWQADATAWLAWQVARACTAAPGAETAAPAAQPEAPAVAAGWALVPVEPTNAMAHAGISARGANTMDVWRAMLAAAPTAQPEAAAKPVLHVRIGNVDDTLCRGVEFDLQPGSEWNWMLLPDGLHALYAAAPTAPAVAVPPMLTDDLDLIDAVLRGYPPSIARRDAQGAVTRLRATSPAAPTMMTQEQIDNIWAKCVDADGVKTSKLARAIIAERDKQWLAACGVRS